MPDAVPSRMAANPKLNQDRTRRAIDADRLLLELPEQILAPAAEVPTTWATERHTNAVIPNAKAELLCSEQRVPSSFKSLVALDFVNSAATQQEKATMPKSRTAEEMESCATRHPGFSISRGQLEGAVARSGIGMLSLRDFAWLGEKG